MTLAELSLRRPVTAVMFFVSMVVIGLIASFRLPLEQFPEVNVPFLMISFPYPGSTPQEVERSITRPAEEALAGKPLNEQTATLAGEAAVSDAKPMSGNAYKVQIAKTAVKRAIMQAAGLKTV